MLRNTVCLCTDASSESDAWVVSLDELDECGGAVTTVTVSVHDDYEAAYAAAIALADRTGRPVVTEDGETKYTPPSK